MARPQHHISLAIFLFLSQLFPDIQGIVWQAKTSEEFSQALESSTPGDVIKLFRDTRYPGDFILPDKGATAAITIDGSGGDAFGNSAEILASGTGLDIQWGKWIIRTLSVKGGTVGISIQGSGHSLQTVSVSGSQKAIVVQGDRNTFQTVTARGSSTGILVQGSGNTLQTVTAGASAGPGIEIVGDQNTLRTVTARGVGAGIIARGNGNQMQTVTSNPPQKISGNGNGGINFGSGATRHRRRTGGGYGYGTTGNFNNYGGTQDFGGAVFNTGGRRGGTRDSFNNYGGGTQSFRNAVFNTGARTGSRSSENVGTGSGNNFNNFWGNQDFTGAVINSGESSGRRPKNKGRKHNSVGFADSGDSGVVINNTGNFEGNGNGGVIMGTNGGNHGVEDDGTNNGSSDSFNSYGGNQDFTGAVINSGESSGRRQRRKHRGRKNYGGLFQDSGDGVVINNTGSFEGNDNGAVIMGDYHVD